MSRRENSSNIGNFQSTFVIQEENKMQKKELLGNNKKQFIIQNNKRF